MKKPSRDTSEYSSSLAPETRDHAEQRVRTGDSRLPPGGGEREGAAADDVGIAGLDRDTSVSGGAATGQTSDGETDAGSAVEGDRREAERRDRPED